MPGSTPTFDKVKFDQTIFDKPTRPASPSPLQEELQAGDHADGDRSISAGPSSTALGDMSRKTSSVWSDGGDMTQAAAFRSHKQRDSDATWVNAPGSRRSSKAKDINDDSELNIDVVEDPYSPREKNRSNSAISTPETLIDGRGPSENEKGAVVHTEEAGLPEDPMGGNTAASTKPSRLWYHPISLLKTLLGYWFLIGMGIFILLAWAFPSVGKKYGDIQAQYTVSYGCIALIFLITGLTLSTTALYNQIKNWYCHLFTQVFSLLFFPTVMFAIVNIIKAANNSTIDPYILVGLMMMSVLPTTVAANVTMTREAKGNEEAATAECCIGQVLGIFLSPLLLQAFMSTPGWEYGQPVASGGRSSSEGLRQIYGQVGQHMGLAIFLPMFVGQAIQNIWKAKTKLVATKLKLPKVGSFLLLILIWAIFCEQFDQKAFESVSPANIILVCFLNLTLYLVFTLITVFLTRLPFLGPVYTNVDGEVQRVPRWRRTLLSLRFNKAEATAICFCSAAKGLVVGSPILDILYGGLPEETRAVISIPLVLYQGEQIACGTLLTYLFLRWNEKPDALIKEKPEEEIQSV